MKKDNSSVKRPILPHMQKSCIEIPTSRAKCKQTAFLLSIRVYTRIMASNIGRRLALTDDFIDDSAFEEKVQEQNQEAIKWKDLPTGVIYQILEELEVDGKFEKKSKILTLRDREGNTIRAWACPTLCKEKDALQGAFVRSTGFKVSKKTKQQYLSYDLVRK